MPDIIPQELAALAEECKAIFTEGVFRSRWELVECYHQLGGRITTDQSFQKWARGNTERLTRLSTLTGIRVHELRRAVKFYAKFPRLDMLPAGKNISWGKVVKLLPDEERLPVSAKYEPLIWGMSAEFECRECKKLVRCHDLTGQETCQDCGTTYAYHFDIKVKG